MIKIAMYDLEGHLLEVLVSENMSQLAETLGIKPSSLLHCLRGENNAAKNRQYREVFRDKPLLKIGSVVHCTLGNKYTPVHKYYKGRYISTYRNAHEAANITKINESLISRCLSSDIKTAGGFECKYAQ